MSIPSPQKMATEGRALLHDQQAGDASDLPHSPDPTDISRNAPRSQFQPGNHSNNPEIQSGLSSPENVSSSFENRGKNARAEDISNSDHDEAQDTVDELPGRLRSSTPRGSSQGLGISPDHQEPAGFSSSRKGRRVTIQNLARVPVGGAYRSPLSTPGLKTPGSGDPLVGSPGTFSQASAGYNPTESTPYEEIGLSYDRAAGAGARGAYDGRGYAARQGNSPQPSPEPEYFQYDNAQQPHHHHHRPRSDTFSIRSMRSTRSAYETDFQPQVDCRTQGSFLIGRGHWLAVTVLILSVYSTIFSGIFVVIALKGFRYGRSISTGGNLSYSTASLLTALFAKTIELSFTTVFVAFLGQVLSRRAFMKRGKGVTLAEMNMRNWIMQPGTMITHYETIQYAALSFLGLVSLMAAIVGMFYTTASDALGTFTTRTKLHLTFYYPHTPTFVLRHALVIQSHIYTVLNGH